MALVGIGSLVLAPRALAHAILLRSEPSDGAVLAEPPKEVRLWFTEDVVPDLSSAEVLDGEGLSIGQPRLRIDPSQQGLVVLTVPDLRPGLYSVAWKVLSQGDAHDRRGLLVFRVGAGAKPVAAAASRQENPLPPLEVALRWFDLAALAALAGAIAVAGWVLSPTKIDRGREARHAVRRARSRVLGWGAVAAGLALAVGIGLVARQVATLGGGTGSGAAGAVTWKLLGGTRWGTLWFAREAVLLALGAILLLAYRAERPDPQPEAKGLRTLALPAAALLVAVLGLVHALAGHAGVGSSNTGLTVAASTVHLLAAGLWVGGLLALLLAWPQLRGGGVPPNSLTRASLRRFGRLALLGFGLIAVTGLYYAGQQVASPDALLTTLYGRALLGKTGLVLAAGAFGLTNALLLHPRAAAPLGRVLRRPLGWTPLRLGRLRTLVLAEACLGLLVLGGAGLLGAAVPARGPEFAPAPEPFPASLSRRVDDLLVTLSVRPNQPGPNVFEVLAVSTRRPALAEIEMVTLRFTSQEEGRAVTPPPLPLVEPGRYRLGGDFLSAGGSWRIEAVIMRPGLERSSTTFDWYLGGSASRHPVVVSNAPLKPPLTRASAVGLLALGAGGAWLLLRRRFGAVSGQRVPSLPSSANGSLREAAPR